MTVLETARLATPVGPFVLGVRGGAVCLAGFGHQWPRILEEERRRLGEVTEAPLDEGSAAIDALRRYLAGELDAIGAVEVDTGGTPFQRRVWEELRRIPAGRTRSYSELAEIVGAPDAIRAVGGANARNPVSIIVPCHRVIAKGGALAGYGGGVERKWWLLQHEGVVLV